LKIRSIDLHHAMMRQLTAWFAKKGNLGQGGAEELSFQHSSQGNHPTEIKQKQLSLEGCIENCTVALAHLDCMVASGSSISGIMGEGSDGSKITYNNDNRNNNLSMSGKIFYH
jgi:hypothetical protein